MGDGRSLQMLSDYGVEDIEMIIATSVHRRMTGPEVRHIVGDKIFLLAEAPLRPRRRGPKGMKEIGTTEEGEVVELNRKAVESDLIIYVNLNFVPMSGGHKLVVVGLCGYRSLLVHHNPKVMRQCWSYMDPPKSALATSVTRMGRLANKHLNVFNIETTVNNRMFDRTRVAAGSRSGGVRSTRAKRKFAPRKSKTRAKSAPKKAATKSGSLR